MPARRRRFRLARKGCYLQVETQLRSWVMRSSSSMPVAELALIFCLEIALNQVGNFQIVAFDSLA